MRVGCFAGFGDPEVMQVATRSDPRPPRSDEVLVAVRASSVNGTDLGLRRGDLKPLTWGRMPFVPGFDLAGEVVARGPAVTALEVGARVAALLPHRGGGLAERVLVPQGRAAVVPAGVSDPDAAAAVLAGLTALQGLVGLGRITDTGARVLVVGGAGGIGSFAVQLGVLAGATVTATTSAGKVDFVRGLGAARVVDRHETALADLGERYDVVLDAAGRSTHRELAPLLAPGGRVVSVRPLHPDTLRRLGRQDHAAVRTAPRPGDLAHLLQLLATGRLRSPVEHVVGLDDVARAHELAETEGRGKVVVDLTARGRDAAPPPGRRGPP